MMPLVDILVDIATGAPDADERMTAIEGGGTGAEDVDTAGVRCGENSKQKRTHLEQGQRMRVTSNDRDRKS
jgi:hypothetical protein